MKAWLGVSKRTAISSLAAGRRLPETMQLTGRRQAGQKNDWRIHASEKLKGQVKIVIFVQKLDL